MVPAQFNIDSEFVLKATPISEHKTLTAIVERHLAGHVMDLKDLFQIPRPRSNVISLQQEAEQLLYKLESMNKHRVNS